MALHIVRKERRLNFRPAGRVASKRHKQRRLPVVANDAHVVLEDLCIEARTAVDRRRRMTCLPAWVPSLLSTASRRPLYLSALISFWCIRYELESLALDLGKLVAEGGGDQPPRT